MRKVTVEVKTSFYSYVDIFTEDNKYQLSDKVANEAEKQVKEQLDQQSFFDEYQDDEDFKVKAISYCGTEEV